MKEWFNKVKNQIYTLWKKCSLQQRIIFIVIICIILAGIVFIMTYNLQSTQVPLLNTTLDEKTKSDVLFRLEEENIDYSINEKGIILVRDNMVARRVRNFLFRENLIPTSVDPWQIFDIDRWTITDFERNVNLRRSIQTQLQQHLESLDDIDSAQVVVNMPEQKLFSKEEYAVTVSVIIVPKPGSNIRENKDKIHGITRLIQAALPNISEENIILTDDTGIQLNDFEQQSMFDDIQIDKELLSIKRHKEVEYISRIEQALSNIFGIDRVQIINVDVTMDYGKHTEVKTEINPIVLKTDNPNTPGDEGEVIQSVAISENAFNEVYKGTGINPQGPPGTEGQVPPIYQNVDGSVADYDRNQKTTNYVVSQVDSKIQGTPQIEKISVSVVLDGVWKRKLDENGEYIIENNHIVREYTPIAAEVLTSAMNAVSSAIGYNQLRGDTVSVENIPFDRTLEFARLDEEFFKSQSIKNVTVYILIGIAGLLILFIIINLILKEIARRRKIAESEENRRRQMEREQQLRDLQGNSSLVEMSVEERTKMELRESVMNVVREQPEEVAQLLRTWLIED